MLWWPRNGLDRPQVGLRYVDFGVVGYGAHGGSEGGRGHNQYNGRIELGKVDHTHLLESVLGECGLQFTVRSFK